MIRSLSPSSPLLLNPPDSTVVSHPNLTSHRLATLFFSRPPSSVEVSIDIDTTPLLLSFSLDSLCWPAADARPDLRPFLRPPPAAVAARLCSSIDADVRRGGGGLCGVEVEWGRMEEAKEVFGVEG
jgi:hypothetical protein